MRLAGLPYPISTHFYFLLAHQGTVRENLDPFQRHTDEELLEVMDKVQLGGPVGHTPSDSRNPSRVPSMATLQDSDVTARATTSKGKIGLDTQISQGGSSVSAGQRQLLALARALLRRSNRESSSLSSHASHS